MPIDAYAAAVASGTWGRDGPHLECVWSAPLSLGGASSEPPLSRPELWSKERRSAQPAGSANSYLGHVSDTSWEVLPGDGCCELAPERVGG